MEFWRWKETSRGLREIDVGMISIAVALAFIDQTFPGDDWRAIVHPLQPGSRSLTSVRLCQRLFAMRGNSVKRIQ